MEGLKIIKFLLNDENLINEFEDYLKENKKEIAMNWITNEIYINEFLETLPIKDKNIINKLYEKLDDYCCQIPF